MTKATKAGRVPASQSDSDAGLASPDSEKTESGDQVTQTVVDTSTVLQAEPLYTLNDAEIGASEFAGLTGAAWIALDDADRSSLLAEHAEHVRMAAIGVSLSSDGADASDQKPPAVAEIKYPLDLVLRNNSRIPVVEMVTYAHLQAGGAANVTVHNDVQLANLRKNLSDVAQANYFDPALLVIDGLPV